MKMQNQMLSLMLLFLLWSCTPDKGQENNEIEGEKNPILVSAINSNATSPFLTLDHVGNPVLCWTEAITDQESFVTKFAVFDRETEIFGDILTVTPSKGTSAHPESMNKVAYKSDGTIVAAYVRKHPTPENRFASSILYSLSMDQGLSWTPEKLLHSDTSSAVGRGYFDLATLPDGQVGAIWLDGRFGNKIKGSALFFAKTTQNQGFGLDKPIGESTCECCRTDLFVDKEDQLHVVYRDILQDSIRDVVHQLSTDNGGNFSQARRISMDNWKIEGCPHTGPSLAQNGDGLHALWFTAGGSPGVYLTGKPNDGSDFSLREKISKDARHPQLAALPKEKLVLVWDELQQTGQALTPHESHHQMNGASNGMSKVVLQVRNSQAVLRTFPLSSAEANASYPVIETMEEGKALVAWAQTNPENSGIFYLWLDLK